MKKLENPADAINKVDLLLASATFVQDAEIVFAAEPIEAVALCLISISASAIAGPTASMLKIFHRRATL